MFNARNILFSRKPLTGVTYTQSSVYTDAWANVVINKPVAATWEGMNSGTADGTFGQTVTGNSLALEWIKADVGASRYISRIVIGYDWNSDQTQKLNWGSGAGFFDTAITDFATLEISTDNTNWTAINGGANNLISQYASATMPNGLYSITINATTRYIRISKSNAYVGVLEFQVWGRGSG